MSLEEILRADPGLMDLLRHCQHAALPEWRLVSGCIYQTVWNVLTGQPRGTGIADYDLIYFDGSDLSWDAEDRVIHGVTGNAPLGPLQVRNQARVHLWYQDHFGAPYEPLRSADEALDRYPIIVQAVGVRLERDRLDIAAPFGLDDLFAMTMRPNPSFPQPDTFAAKLARARTVWPGVRGG